MSNLPMIHVAEWKKLQPLLPPTGGPGKPRSDDRLMLSGLFYSAATKCSLESLPVGYGNPRSLRTRRSRWTADGTLPRRRRPRAGDRADEERILGFGPHRQRYD